PQRRTGHGQGQPGDAGPAHDVRLAHALGLREPVRSDRDHAAARGGRRHLRQVEHGRVRDGLVDGAQALRSHAEPAGARLCPRAPTSAATPVPAYRAAAQATMKGVVVGRPREYFPPDLEPALGARCDRALERLRALGVEVRDVSLPHTALAIPVYYIIAPAEA